MLGALLLVGGCELDPLDLVGRHCDSTRGCGDGLECVEGECVLHRKDGGVHPPPVDAGFGLNLLANPGFEDLGIDGGLAGWKPSAGQLFQTADSRRDGGHSARLQAGGVAPSLLSDPVQGKGLQSYCASAWVHTELDAGYDAVLQVRERFPDGGARGSNSTGFARGRPDGGWIRLLESFTPFDDNLIDVRVFTSVKPPLGESLFIDDVQLWRQPESQFPCLP